jgi:hypothetical protein
MPKKWRIFVMILYHGSNVYIHNIELQRCKPYKDFGRGFYCTTIKSQAELMAKRVATIYGGKSGITQFELDESIFADTDVNVKKFEGASKDWAVFVLNNRNRHFTQMDSLECNHDNKYDMVVGPVANDDLALLFRTYTSGLVDLEALTKGLKYKMLTNQYSFHTERALKYLKPAGVI